MDHHTSWLSFLPGYGNLEHYVTGHYTNVLPPGPASTVHHIVAGAIVLVLLMVMSLMARARLVDLEKAIIPPRTFGVVAFFELVIEAIVGLMASIIGPTYKRYVPVIGTLGLFVLVSNVLGLIPGMLPPTDNFNTTFAAAMIVFVYFNYHGLRTHGVAHITHLMNPVGTWWGWFLAPLLFPIELISLLVRPVTLGIRLCANMVGDHAVLLAFAGIMPLLVPLPFYVLGLLICIIQTAVFVILSCVYISLHASEAEAHH